MAASLLLSAADMVQKTEVHFFHDNEFNERNENTYSIIVTRQTAIPFSVHTYYATTGSIHALHSRDKAWG